LSACSLLPRSLDASSSLKDNILFGKFNLSGLRARLCVGSLLLGSLGASLSLKEKVLTLSVDLEGRRHVYVLVHFTRGLQSSFFSFRREGLDLEVLSLR